MAFFLRLVAFVGLFLSFAVLRTTHAASIETYKHRSNDVLPHTLFVKRDDDPDWTLTYLAPDLQSAKDINSGTLTPQAYVDGTATNAWRAKCNAEADAVYAQTGEVVHAFSNIEYDVIATKNNNVPFMYGIRVICIRTSKDWGKGEGIGKVITDWTQTCMDKLAWRQQSALNAAQQIASQIGSSTTTTKKTTSKKKQ